MRLPPLPSSGSVQDYFLGYLLRFEGETLLSNLRGIDCRVGFEIKGETSQCRYLLVLTDGAIERVEAGWEERPEVVYRTAEETFYRVVGGRQKAQSAFLRGQIRIEGSFLKGLKLAFLLQEFFDRFPYRPEELERVYLQEQENPDETDTLPAHLIEEAITLPCSDLQIKAVYSEDRLATFGAILVPPHPYLGGSSENRLLLKLSSVLASSGVFVVRFDYLTPLATTAIGTGVGSFWEESDAGVRLGVEEFLTLHGWMDSQAFLKDVPTVWIGYSYGAQVCLWALENKSPDHLVCLSPVVSHIGQERLNCGQEMLLIGGTEDFATTPNEVADFSLSLIVPPKFRMIEGADHFFTDKEEQLVESVVAFLGLETANSQHEGGVGGQ